MALRTEIAGVIVPSRIEQRRSDEAQDREVQARRSRLDAAHAEQEREQGDDAALAAVVGPQDEDAVLDRDDDDQRPQDQGEDAQDRVRVAARRGWPRARLP